MPDKDRDKDVEKLGFEQPPKGPKVATDAPPPDVTPSSSARYRVVHPCAFNCKIDDVVGRERFRPRAHLSNDDMEKATDDVITRLTEMGAIVKED